MKRIILRVLLGILTAPLWLPLGAVAFVIYGFALIVYFVASVILFAFSGKWDWDAFDIL